MYSEDALYEILQEHKRAEAKFCSFASCHEGYAVILEELDELWDAIKNKNGSKEKLKKEAIQVGAMALRFLVDCIEG